MPKIQQPHSAICMTCGRRSGVEVMTACRGALVCDTCVGELMQSLVDSGRFKGLQWTKTKIRLYLGKAKR